MATIRKWHAPHNVMFSDIGNKSDVKKIIDYAKGLLKTPDLDQLRFL